MFEIVKKHLSPENISPQHDFENFPDIFFYVYNFLVVYKARADYCTKSFGSNSTFEGHGVFRRRQPQYQPRPVEDFASTFAKF